MSDYRDLGDTGDFDTPPTNVERFLTTNPRYGEQIAEKLSAEFTRMGEVAGKAIHKAVFKEAMRLSNIYTDRIINICRKGLTENLPDNVDTSDLEEYMREKDASVEEFFEDTYFEATADACYIFATALLPYLGSLPRPAVEGVDQCMPHPINDLVWDTFPQVPPSPKEPTDERLL